MSETTFRLPENCEVADFVVFPAWKVAESRYGTKWARVVRRVWSSGAQVLELQTDFQDSGACSDQFKAERDPSIALDILLRKLAEIHHEKVRTGLAG